MDRSNHSRVVVAVLAAVIAAWAIAASLYFARTGRLPIPIPRFERDALAHDLEVLTVEGDVLFAYRSAVILPAGTAVLDEVADLVGAHSEFGVFVDGHADSRGEAEYNLELSLRRAEAVVAYLVEQGIARAQLHARGFGETSPRAPNTTDEGRSRNRRVEFRLQ